MREKQKKGKNTLDGDHSIRALFMCSRPFPQTFIIVENYPRIYWGISRARVLPPLTRRFVSFSFLPSTKTEKKKQKQKPHSRSGARPEGPAQRFAKNARLRGFQSRELSSPPVARTSSHSPVRPDGTFRTACPFTRSYFTNIRREKRLAPFQRYPFGRGRVQR